MKEMMEVKAGEIFEDRRSMSRVEWMNNEKQEERQRKHN